MSFNCPECAPGKPCRWYCPVDERHHPVHNMVTDCLERATNPDGVAKRDIHREAG